MKTQIHPDQIERFLQQNPEMHSSYAFEKNSKRFAMAAYYSQHGSQRSYGTFRVVGLGIGLVLTACVLVLSVPNPHEQSSLDSISFSLEAL